MSDVSEEEKPTHPTKEKRIASPSIRDLDCQEEPRNTQSISDKESVGNTTEYSLNTNNRSQARSENSLGGNTPRDSQTQDTLLRGAVGNTAVTPIDQREDSLRGNTLRDSQTPDIQYRGTVENTAVTPISPATSTPGSTPARHKKGELKNSELQSSEESIIGTSITDEDRRQEIVDDEDFITLKMADYTLAEKSVEEDESHDVEDTLWETTVDNTDSKEEGPISCVAHRTRSHTEDLRKNNLSQFLDDCNNTTMEESFEVIGDKASDSMTLKKYEKEDQEWDNKNEWCLELVKLNSSIDKAIDVLNTRNRIETLEIYRKKGAEAAKDYDLRRKNPDENKYNKPGKSDRGVTFIVDQPEYSSALKEVIKSLETLLKIKIDTAPRRNIENIIKIILAICIEFNEQMQNAQETITTMAGVIEELMLQRYKIETLEVENKKLEESKEKLETVNERLKDYNDHMREYTEKFTKPIEGVEENRDMLNELFESKVETNNLNKKIEKLKAENKKRENEYDVVWGRKKTIRMK